jgi:redox-sensitive bicupin YhaK (pirin superfamily)
VGVGFDAVTYMLAGQMRHKDNCGDGVTVHVISGLTIEGTSGLVKNIPTKPLYLDIEFEEGASEQPSTGLQRGMYG